MNKREQIYVVAFLLFILFLFLISFKEGMLDLNHAIDISGILQDKIPASTQVQMISMLGVTEPEDPLFYNVLIDNAIDPPTKVTHLNAMIQKYFNTPQK
jgi:hypothetical protein